MLNSAVSPRILGDVDRENVQFPNVVAYFEGAEDVPGDREKSILRVKNGQMVVVYKTDDPLWWLAKVRPPGFCRHFHGTVPIQV